MKLKDLYYLVDILVGDIRDLFFVVYGKQVNTGVVRLHGDNKCDDSHSATFTFPFAFDSKSYLVFSPTQVNACIGVVHQFMLQCIDVIRQRAITLGQTLGLTKKLLGIVKRDHKMLCLCSKFFNQGIERREVLAGKLSFPCLLETASNSFLDKSMLNVGIGTHTADFNTFDGTKNLLEAWNKANILNIQNNLRHTILFCKI